MGRVGRTWRRWHLAAAAGSAVLLAASALTGTRTLEVLPWPASVDRPYALEFVDVPVTSANTGATSGDVVLDADRSETTGTGAGAAANDQAGGKPTGAGPAATGNADGARPPSSAGASPQQPAAGASTTASTGPTVPDSRGVVRIWVAPSTTTTPTPGSSTTTQPAPSTSTTSTPPGSSGGGGDGADDGSLGIGDTSVLRDRVSRDLRAFAISELVVYLQLDDVAGLAPEVIEQARLDRAGVVVATVGLPAERVDLLTRRDGGVVVRVVSLAELDRLAAAPAVRSIWPLDTAPRDPGRPPTPSTTTTSTTTGTVAATTTTGTVAATSTSTTSTTGTVRPVGDASALDGVSLGLA
jgi:hypothetical protein